MTAPNQNALSLTPLKNWWECRNTLSKVAIVIGGVYLTLMVIAMVMGIVSRGLEESPTYAPYNPVPTISSEEWASYRQIACQYAVRTGFNYEMALNLATYDFGEYHPVVISLKVINENDGLAAYCHNHR